jgi:Tfp pilus assembly protein PilN
MAMNNTTFLPEDYLAKRAEMRTNLISLALFAVVMLAVVGAFLFTSRQGRMLKQKQEQINAEYQKAGQQIQELTTLQQQKDEMLSKAAVAGALVERVPRSILLAELINRMPPQLALLEFDMKSEKLKPPAPPQEKDSKGRLVTSAKDKLKTKQDAGETVKKVEVPKYKVAIAMTGVAPSDLEVAKFMQELNSFVLLQNVTLEYSEQKEIEGRVMRQFKIHLALNPEEDVRDISQTIVPRIKNPMTDELQFNPPVTEMKNTASAQPVGEEGR